MTSCHSLFHAVQVKKDSFDEQPHSPQIGVEHDQLAGHSTLSSQSRPTQVTNDVAHFLQTNNQRCIPLIWDFN